MAGSGAKVRRKGRLDVREVHIIVTEAGRLSSRLIELCIHCEH